jgi:hypothetical protein
MSDSREAPDAAARAGRIAGAAVKVVGKRLLRQKVVREALRRAKRETEGGGPAGENTSR